MSELQLAGDTFRCRFPCRKEHLFSRLCLAGAERRLPRRRAFKCGQLWLKAAHQRVDAVTPVPRRRGKPRTRKTLADPEYTWLAAQLHPTKNELGLRLDDISAGCGTRLWWQCQGCPTCGRVHEWKAPVARRAGSGGTPPSGCPSCSASGGGPGVSPCFCRSVASDAQLRREFSEGNGGVLPEAVALNSNIDWAWVCLRRPSHPAYQATAQQRSFLRSGCPECGREASRIRTRRGTLSDEHPILAAQWDHELNDRTPSDVTCGSGYTASWICPNSSCEHPHKWEASIRDRVGKGSGCPFCSGLRCCPCNSVAGQYPELLAEWDSANNAAEGRVPEQVSPGSQRLIWWKNDKKGSWQQTPKERVTKLKRREGLQRADGQLGKA